MNLKTRAGLPDAYNEFKNISELKEGINSYVDKYNNRRFHSSIGYKKPMDVYLSAFLNAA